MSLGTSAQDTHFFSSSGWSGWKGAELVANCCALHGSQQTLPIGCNVWCACHQLLYPIVELWTSRDFSFGLEAAHSHPSNREPVRDRILYNLHFQMSQEQACRRKQDQEPVLRILFQGLSCPAAAPKSARPKSLSNAAASSATPRIDSSAAPRTSISADATETETVRGRKWTIM